MFSQPVSAIKQQAKDDQLQQTAKKEEAAEEREERKETEASMPKHGRTPAALSIHRAAPRPVVAVRCIRIDRCVGEILAIRGIEAIAKPRSERHEWMSAQQEDDSHNGAHHDQCDYYSNNPFPDSFHGLLIIDWLQG